MAWLRMSRCEAARLAAQLPHRLEQRDRLEHERDGQHDVRDRIVVGARRTVEQLGDAVPHGNRRPDHEQPHRRQQRPDVGLSSVAERSQRVGRTSASPVGDHQEELVSGVGPGMRGFCGHRSGSGQHGGCRLGNRDRGVDPERDQHGADASGAFLHTAGTSRHLLVVLQCAAALLGVTKTGSLTGVRVIELGAIGPGPLAWSDSRTGWRRSADGSWCGAPPAPAPPCAPSCRWARPARSRADRADAFDRDGV